MALALYEQRQRRHLSHQTLRYIGVCSFLFSSPLYRVDRTLDLAILRGAVYKSVVPRVFVFKYPLILTSTVMVERYVHCLSVDARNLRCETLAAPEV